MIYILEGRGAFESRLTGPLEIGPGTIFLLFPGVWHRYRPRRDTGWVESWIEISGPAVERLERAGIISPRAPVHQIGRRAALEGALDECHRLAEAREAGFQPVMAALGLEILARLQQARLPRHAADRDTAAAVRQAQEVLSTQLDRMVGIEEYARRAGLSYSAFRHAFRAAAGESPKQFHLQMRLRKARDFLQNTALPVGRIAGALGFGSTFHFSACFKKHVGMAPLRWRQRQLGMAARGGGPEARLRRAGISP